jgi:hypothetical protein
MAPEPLIQWCRLYPVKKQDRVWGRLCGHEGVNDAFWSDQSWVQCWHYVVITELIRLNTFGACTLRMSPLRSLVIFLVMGAWKGCLVRVLSSLMNDDEGQRRLATLLYESAPEPDWFVDTHDFGRHHTIKRERTGSPIGESWKEIHLGPWLLCEVQVPVWSAKLHRYFTEVPRPYCNTYLIYQYIFAYQKYNKINHDPYPIYSDTLSILHRMRIRRRKRIF